MILIGILIGLYGYLFPGNINLMVLDLYRTKKFKLLFFILVLILVFETMYCSVSLNFLTFIKEDSSLFFKFKFGSYLLLVVMGLWMLFENRKNLVATQKNTLYRGVFNTIIHPQQIPFWLIVGVFINSIIDTTNIYTLSGFVLFNAIGTLLVMILYMFFGNKILDYFKLNLSHLTKIMAVVYLLVASFSFFMLV